MFQGAQKDVWFSSCLWEYREARGFTLIKHLSNLLESRSKWEVLPIRPAEGKLTRFLHSQVIFFSQQVLQCKQGNYAGMLH